MIDRNPNPILPQYGSANQTVLEEALTTQLKRLDLGRLARRGRLYLLWDAASDPQTAIERYSAFYTSKQSDPMYALCHTFNLDETTDDDNGILAAMVVHNMTLYAVGGNRARIWVWRQNKLLPVLPNPRGSAVGIADEEPALAEVITNSNICQRRLYPGDSAVLTDAAVGQRMAPRVLRLSGLVVQPDAVARAVAQQLRTGAHPQPPVVLVTLPGEATTPGMTPTTGLEYSRSVRPKATSQTNLPPVLIAIMIAAVAITLWMLINRPRITPQLIMDILMPPADTTQTAPAESLTPGTGTPELTPTADETETPKS
ncbi:MAG: hypothetical protein GXY52_05940 [Chloroflexi bacterium]|nr:hypothetical protein [Chloroflexota bacterium]